MNLYKLFFASLFCLMSVKGFASIEETIYVKLSEFKPCNISTVNAPSSNIEKGIRNLTDLFNRTKDFDIEIFSNKFEKFIFSKKSFSCFEKINLIKLYAGYQYAIQNPNYSEKLYQKLGKFRGLDNEFQRFIDTRISASKQAARFVQNNIARENTDSTQISEQNGKAKINENEKIIFFFEKELKELKELLKIERDKNLQYLSAFLENEELRNELEKIKQSNRELSSKKDINLQSSLEKKYNQTLDDLEKANERLNLMSINLDNKQRDLRNSQTDVDLLTRELSEYEMLLESGQQEYTPENFIDNNSLYWLWTAFFVALLSAFYFYNENTRKEVSGNANNTDDFANALEGILQQIQPNENLDKFMDPYIFNYIRGYCEGFINSDLESKILLHDLISSLSSKSYFEHNKNFITDDSDLALEGRVKGKKDGQRLRNNSVPIVLRNYLKKDTTSK